MPALTVLFFSVKTCACLNIGHSLHVIISQPQEAGEMKQVYELIGESITKALAK